MLRKSKNAVKEGEAAATGGEEMKEEEDTVDEEEYVPAEGSWVAELEETQEELSEILNSPGGAQKRRGEALKVYLRLCRSYRMLRQWDKLDEAAKKGLKVLSSYSASASSGTSSKISEWKGKFKAYREESGREKSVPSDVDAPKSRAIFDAILKGEADPVGVARPHGLYSNSNLFHHAVLVGDMPLMEAMVARVTGIEFPFFGDTFSDYRPPVVAPADATALVVACANLALAELDHFALREARRNMPEVWGDEKLDGSAQCAMQLVRLGANPNRTFNLHKAQDNMLKQVFRSVGCDGKSALELAKMTQRTELIDLMEQHLRYSPEERADVVHCRCGSRLPWKVCHATGLGQPEHYRDMPTLGGIAYRLSPYARCPCMNTALPHYDCCWKDSAKPAYLLDGTGQVARLERIPQDSHAGRIIQETYDRSGPNAELPGNELELRTVDLLRSPSASNFRELFAGEGPKSQWQTWDPVVYSGCVRRLNGAFFLWKDLHWNLDKSEILKRTELWNRALDKYSDDMDLVGEERERVIARHKANPCAPCGRVGCDAFEGEVREFPRCSRCKMIAYCGRTCQKLDWAEHRKGCGTV